MSSHAATCLLILLTVYATSPKTLHQESVVLQRRTEPSQLPIWSVALNRNKQLPDLPWLCSYLQNSSSRYPTSMLPAFFPVPAATSKFWLSHVFSWNALSYTLATKKRVIYWNALPHRPLLYQSYTPSHSLISQLCLQDLHRITLFTKDDSLFYPVGPCIAFNICFSMLIWAHFLAPHRTLECATVRKAAYRVTEQAGCFVTSCSRI